MFFVLFVKLRFYEKYVKLDAQIIKGHCAVVTSDYLPSLWMRQAEAKLFHHFPWLPNKLNGRFPFVRSLWTTNPFIGVHEGISSCLVFRYASRIGNRNNY